MNEEKKPTKNIVPFTDADERLLHSLAERRDRLSSRFPLIWAMGATFGLVAILYGFEKLIDRVDLFVDKPWILLVTGVVVLVITGSTYKKL